MNIKLLAALIVAIALAASHWKVYVLGKNNKQADWDKAKLIANDAARETERINRNSKEKALEAQKSELVANATAARRAADTANSLRESSERSLQTSRESHAACVISAATHAELLGRCESSYRGMAEKAQGHAADVRALVESWLK